MWEFKISEVSFLTGLALCKNLGKNISIYKIIPFFHKLIGCGSTTIMYGTGKSIIDVKTASYNSENLRTELEAKMQIIMRFTIF